MQFLLRNRYLIFLILLLSLFMVTSFIPDETFASWYATFNYSLLLLAGLNAFRDVKNFLRFTTLFFLIAITVDWFELFYPELSKLIILRALLSATVLSLLLIMTLESIQRARKISRDVIFGALCGYILIGYIGTYMAMAVSLIYPGSYNVEGELQVLEAAYFSFVTMTTLGYGEILPLSEPARAVTMLLSILGPMYVAILVAMIVGKYASITESFTKH